jgi:hypothetical protein
MLERARAVCDRSGNALVSVALLAKRLAVNYASLVLEMVVFITKNLELVERKGIEPSTFALRTRRSPS